MMAMRAVLLLCAVLPCAAHFMWITQSDGEASVTFSESPGKPGPVMFLQNLSASTKVAAATSCATRVECFIQLMFHRQHEHQHPSRRPPSGLGSRLLSARHGL